MDTIRDPLAEFDPYKLHEEQKEQDALSTSKINSLQRAREAKTRRLVGNSNSVWGRAGIGESDLVQDNYINTIDGFRESTGNKIFNDYTWGELDHISGQVSNQYGIEETEDGTFINKSTGTPFSGDFNDYATVYKFKTKDGNDKIGMTHHIDPRDRWSPETLEKFGAAIGEAGVDPNQLVERIIVPRELAVRIEGLYNGSSDMLNRRVVRQKADGDLSEYQALRDLYGSGATEIYRPIPENERVELSQDHLESAWKDFNERFKIGQRGQYSTEEVAQILKAKAYRESSAIDKMLTRGANAAKAIPTTLALELAIKPADLVAEWFGKDLGSAEELTAVTDAFFGYDRSHSAGDMEVVQGHVANLYDAVKNGEDIDMSDIYSTIGTIATNPELLVEVAAGTAAFLVGFGKFTKVGRATNAVRKEYQAGNITKEVAKQRVKQIKKDHTLLNNVSNVAASNVGLGLVTAGMVSTNIDEFKENNGGEATASDIIRVTALTSASAGIEKVAGMFVLRDFPGVKKLGLGEQSKQVKEIVDDMSAAEYATFHGKLKRSLGAINTVTTTVGSAAVSEGITEYIQTLTEVTSTRYQTEKYGSDFAELMASRETQIDAFTGLALGSVAGGAISGTGLGVKTGINKLTESVRLPAASSDETPVDTDSDNAKEIFEKYKTISSNLNNTTEVTEDNLSQLLKDVGNAKQLSEMATILDPELATATNDRIKVVETMIAERIEGSNGEVSIGQVLDADKGTKPLSDKSTNILASRAIQLVVDKYGGKVPEDVETILYSFARNNKVTAEQAKNIIKSYESVESEATIEDRGVQTRDERLTLLLDSDNPDPVELKRSYDEAAKFYRATEQSIAQLEEGLAKAKEEAQLLQARKPTGGKSETVTTEYMTHPQSSSKGAPFTLSVSYNNGKWAVAPGHVEQVQKLIKAKQRTSSSLVKLLERHHQEATEHLDPATMLSFNEYRITTPAGKVNAGVKKEQDFVKAVTDTVRDVLKLPTARINKVILGKSVDPQWEPSGRRAQENSRITNVVTGNKGSAEYSASDVVYLHTNNSAKTRKEGLIELNSSKGALGQELDAAIRAGATIVLSNSHRVKKSSDESSTPNDNRGASIAKWLKKKGYMSLGTAGAEKDIFVPATDEIKARYEENKIKNKEERAKKAKQDRLINKAINLSIERRNKKLYDSDRSLEDIEAEIKDISEQITDQFTPLAKSVVDREIKESIKSAKANVKEGETFDEQSVTPNQEEIDKRVAAKVKENIQKFLDNKVESNIKDTRDLVTAVDSDLTIEGIENDDLRNLVDQSIIAEKERTAVNEVLLSAWSKATDNKASPKETLEQLREAMKEQGIEVFTERTENTPDNAIVLSEVGKNILNNAVTAGNDSSIYFTTFVKKGEKGEDVFTTIPYFTLNTRTTVDGVVTKVERKVGDNHKKHGEVVRISRFDVDPTNYVKVSKHTPLNTLPVSFLPEVFGDIAASTEKAFKATIAPLIAEERTFSPTRQESREGLHNLADSPARTLIYDKDGKVNENTFAAMGIAVRSYMERNKRNMIPGPKDDAVVAAMFGITEDNITEEHKNFARNNGVLAKTAINDIGKSVLTTLGIGKIKDTEQNRDLFTRLTADIGNMAVLTAEKEGLVSLKKNNSNDYAKLTKKGKVIDGEKGEATVDFLEVSNVTGKTESGFTRKVPTDVASKALLQQEKVESYIEDAVGARKEPYYGKPVPPEVQDELVRSVRNDITGAGTPAAAAKSMKLHMNTEYELNTEVYNDLAPYLDSEEGVLKVKERLGYIEISEKNPAYIKLPYAAKEVQENINRDIEKSIDELKRLHSKIQEGVIPNSIYFPVAFSKVQRYEFVSNTVQSQTDKFHRFLVAPKSFKLKHTVDRKNNTFSHTYEEGKKTVTKDTSLLVRAALAQALGTGIDKTLTLEIVNLGNDLLAMTHKDVLNAESKFMDTGEFVFHNGEETITLEPDHLGHALVAIKFLKDFTKNPNSKSITSSLSMEYDAITSGFGNKIQQYALIDNLNEESRKVGIVKYDPATEGLSEGEGLNDMFADKQFSDNYQNLGRIAVSKVVELSDTLDTAPKKDFKGIQKLLPGNDIFNNLEDGAISKALRTLFKPPFMTFNYSASISSIRKAMNSNIVDTMFKEIAKADLNTDTDVKEVANYLASIVKVNKKTVDAEGLQNAIRNIDDKYITVTRAAAKSGVKTEKVYTTVSLKKFLSEGVLDDTYGEAVKSAFEEKYADFIEIQNATNDAFQAAFAVFNQLLVQKVKNHWDENKRTITEADMKRFINELRPAFPAIAGPLSSEIDEGVHVYAVDTLSPNALMATTPSPQTKLKKGGEADSRKVNLLIKSITASANAGAVSPFLAIDGAQLSSMVNSFAEEVLHNSPSSEIIPLHDAYISALHLMDEAGYQYNKNTVKLHKGYSIMEEVLKMVEVTDSIVKGSHDKLSVKDAMPTFLDTLKVNSNKDTKYGNKVIEAKKSLPQLKTRLELEKKAGKDTTETLQQIADVEAILSFDSQVAQIKNQVTVLNTRINEARESMYDDGDVVSPMVGLGDSAYVVGSDQNRAGTAIAEFYSDFYTATKRKGKVTDLGDQKIDKIDHTSTLSDELVAETYSLVSLKSKRQAKKLFKIASKAIDGGVNILFNVDRDTGADAVYNNLLEQGIATSSFVKINGKEYLLITRTEVESEPELSVRNYDDTSTPEDGSLVKVVNLLSDGDAERLAKALGVVLDIKNKEC